MRLILIAASVEDIAAIEGIGRSKANEIHQVMHGILMPQPKWAGVERVVLWNKLTKKKVAGAAAPTVEKATAWLASNSNYELYNGQDQQVGAGCVGDRHHGRAGDPEHWEEDGHF